MCWVKGHSKQGMFHNVWILNARWNARTLKQVGNSRTRCKKIISIEGWLSMCTLKEVEAFGYPYMFWKSLRCNPIDVFHVFPIGVIKLKCLQCIGKIPILVEGVWGRFKAIHLMPIG